MQKTAVARLAGDKCLEAVQAISSAAIEPRRRRAAYTALQYCLIADSKTVRTTYSYQMPSYLFHLTPYCTEARAKSWRY